MVNNANDINKTNNLFSLQIIEHNNKTTTYDAVNPGPGLGSHKIGAGLNRLMGFHTSCLMYSLTFFKLVFFYIF